MKTNRLTFAAVLIAGSAIAMPAFAQSPPHHEMGHGPSRSGAPHFSFAHRDFGHFSAVERSNWTGGHWNHGWHNGRFGWWWFAGGAFYFYAAPVYPYPAYVSDDYVDDESYGPGPGGAMWYWCARPAGYYPYVQTCSLPWRPVPAGAPQGYGPGPGYQGSDNGPDQGPPPGYQGPPQGYQGPPQGYQGPPGDQGPPPGYQGQPPGDQGPPPGYQGPPGYPPDGPPPGYQGQDDNQPPPGYPQPGPQPPGSQPPREQ